MLLSLSPQDQAATLQILWNSDHIIVYICTKDESHSRISHTDTLFEKSQSPW